MLDLTGAVKPKSDQLNADDLVGGSMMLEITGVRLVQGDQPIVIDYVGGKGRPYKPCKSMARVLISLWGKNGEVYVGRKIVVYNDANVKWAGKAVGGIRISHMSHIDKDERIMITEARGKKTPHLISKLETQKLNKISAGEYSELANKLLEAKTLAELQEIRVEIKNGRYDNESNNSIGELYKEATSRIRESSENQKTTNGEN